MDKKTAIIAGTGLGLAAAGLYLLRRTEEADLSGQVVFITGGSRGLGLQLAREFAAACCQIALCARDSHELKHARADLEKRGARVHTVTCDVTSQDQVKSAVSDVIDHFGRIDILVNNAGIIQVGPIDSMTVADFEQAMAVMFWGMLYTTLAVLPGMQQRGAGRIVNITSIGGKVSVPHLIPYSCAKFAAVGLSEGLRAELAPKGISVTTVVPGLMRTGSHLQAKFKGNHAREFAWFSLGAATPVVSVSAEHAARSIVKSTQRGDAENIISLPANLMARLHGALPELTQPILALVNRFLLPEETAHDHTVSGHEAKEKLNSRVLDAFTRMGQSAAADLNELHVHQS